MAAVVVMLGTGAGVAGVALTGGERDGASQVAPTVAPPTPQLPALIDPGPVLPADAGDEPVPDPTALAAALGPELTDPRLGSRVVAHVVDLPSGQVLFDQASDALVTPASATKLVTGLAVATTLDPGARLTTTIRSGSEPGQVVLVGGGDPTLRSDRESAVYPGSASLTDLAAQVTASGIGPVSSVVVDSSLFTGPLTGPGWSSGDAPSLYAAPITAAMVDGGRLDPQFRQRSGTPDLDAGRALAAALGVPDVPVTRGTAPPGATALGEVQSAPMQRLLEQMLSGSDNVLAEALARHVALASGDAGSFDGAAAAVRAAVSTAGVDLGAATLVDGSGLSELNRLSASVLTAVLSRAADRDDALARVLLGGLPVAGYDGTLADRYPDGAPGAGEVRAKTGTLNGVNALAGVLQTADGRLLAFAFIADQAPLGGIDPAEAALDEAAAVLAGCGCR